MVGRKNNPLIRFLGKILFPGQASWKQRASVVMVLWAMAAGIFVCGVIVAFMLLHGGR
jgi:hypothetical protein